MLSEYWKKLEGIAPRAEGSRLIARGKLLEDAMRHFNTGAKIELEACLAGLFSLDIDAEVIDEVDRFLPLLAKNKRLVATFDENREPKPDELIIVVGSYPHQFSNLISNNPVKRDVTDFWKFQFDEVQFSHCWDDVDVIIIINIDARFDRYYSVLRELVRLQAPLHKVQRVSAIVPSSNDLSDKGESHLKGQVGCLLSHIAAIRITNDVRARNALILEDDFIFTTETRVITTQIATFFSRKYDYSICLLGSSKYGERVRLDDLVSASFQSVTNTEAYFVSRNGAVELLRCFEEALRLLQQERDPSKYAVDRYWTILQDGARFLVFTDKLGFQAPSFSDIDRRYTAFFD
jgi:GR25 family glycosyltransferase involved in LPS biosynthesis